MAKNETKLRMRWAVVRPEMATKWLRSTNTHNRNLSPARVALYAADMAAGRWLQSAQPILFDERGTLMDGQHRLAALIDSDTTQTFLVIEGINKSVQLVIDSGRPRTDADKLRLGKGMDVTPRKVGVARAMMFPTRHGEKSPKRRKPTTSELADFAAKHDASISFACQLFSRRKTGVTQAPVAAVVARAWYTQDRKRLADFAEVLYTGINRGEKDVAAVRLRDSLDEGLSRRGTSEFGVFYGKIESALASFLTGAAPARLLPAKGELFPLPGESVAEPSAAGGRLTELEKVDSR